MKKTYSRGGWGLEAVLEAVSETPEWLKKIKKNAKARERYFIKRYGEEEGRRRMKAKDDAFQKWMDDESSKEELGYE